MEKFVQYKEGLKDKIVKANKELAGLQYKYKV
jgi:hypothetical protein